MATAVQDEKGPFWETPYYDKGSGQFLRREYHEIFNGGAGIALFFLALFELNKDKTDLEWAEKITDRILKSTYCRRPKFYCFYTGICGIIYLCIKLYEITGKDKYLETALLLAKEHHSNIIYIQEMDLLSGAAGNTLVMTLLYHHTADATIYSYIQLLLNRIIDDARVAPQGIKWDHKKMAYDSLTGFSHGAAGIAYVLLQVGHYFNYDGLIRLAKLGFDYEMLYYDMPTHNWLDLRIGAHRYNLPGAHTWDLSVFRPTMKQVNSWAHGAVGIGLSHMLFENITGEDSYHHIIEASVKSSLTHLDAAREDYTLCSGYGGMVTFLLRATSFYADQQALHHALHKIATGAFELYERTGTFNTFAPTNSDDMGLLSGMAGVGYMLINILQKGNCHDVLNIQLPARNIPVAPSYTSASIGQKIFGKYFRRTLYLLNQNDIPVEHLSLPDYQQALEKLITDPFVQQVYAYEQQLCHFWETHKGFLCYYKRNDHTARQLSNPAYAAICGISDHARIVECAFHPDTLECKGPVFILQELTPEGITEKVTNRLTAAILSQLRQDMPPAILVANIADLFDASASALAKETVWQQLLLLGEAGLITAKQ